MKATVSVPVALCCAVLAATSLPNWCRTAVAQDAPTNPELAALPLPEQAIFKATLQDGLEHVPSGQSLKIGPTEEGYSVRVTPRRTFRTGAGVFCREYGILLTYQGKRSTFADIACRSKAGVWQPAR